MRQSRGLFRGEYFQRAFTDSIVGITVTQTKETAQNLGPRPFLRRLRGSLLRLRSMMRLEVKPVAREWHLRDNEGHDGLITAGYTAAGQDYRDTSNGYY